MMFQNSELRQTGAVLFLIVDSSTTSGTSQVLVSLLLSTFDNKTKPVWPSSEVASVNALFNSAFTLTTQNT